ncbi:hypothetical protein HMPREF0724_10295 [Prescottella equi ATCC 33707]|uniref:Uncharacterized protein n=1 Tax=Prescottella equi ATCC 33707 TaxID=525370 RepID=E9SVZ5_RHOHA|nr:hypothetical protein HMPREF0724_10295 [Prescottella equi ATCC 33707]
MNSLDSADRRRFYVDRSWTGLRSDVPTAGVRQARGRPGCE